MSTELNGIDHRFEAAWRETQGRPLEAVYPGGCAPPVYDETPAKRKVAVKQRGPFLRDPTKPRPGEVIGGGWFVFRRGGDTKRIRASNWPFEHGSFEAAAAEAKRLADKEPGKAFDVVQVVCTYRFATAENHT